MEVRQLEQFLAVVEEKSFTRAAQRLHLVQSAVSATVKAMEREAGSPLFVRGSRSVELTAEGAALVPAARRAVAALDDAHDVVAGFRGALRGSVSLGLLAAPDFLDIPRLLRVFRDTHPEASVSARTSPNGAEGLIGGLLDETLDVSLLVLPLPAHPDIAFDELIGSGYVFAVARDHPLARRTGVVPADLATTDVVTMLRGFSLRRVLDEQFARWGLRPEVRIEVSDVSTMIRCLVAGLGVGLVPDYVLGATPELAPLDVGPTETRWAAALASKRGRRRSAAVAAFVDLIIAEVPRARARMDEMSRPGG